MDIQCHVCTDDFLFFDAEFVKLKCNHMFHQECLKAENNSCPACRKSKANGKECSQQVAITEKKDDEREPVPATNSEIKWVIEEDDVRPVTWSELDRLRKDCDRLLAIFAEYVADVASGDRKTNPTKYMQNVTNAATRIAYPTVLLKKISEGLTGYKDETESLYRKDENNNLINFGIPIRYNEETTITVNAVRRCISQLNKCMEIEITRTANFGKWEQELRQMFPNLHDDDMMLATIDPSTRISLSESEDHSSPEY